MLRTVLATLASTLVLAACGGGGGGGDVPPPVQPPPAQPPASTSTATLTVTLGGVADNAALVRIEGGGTSRVIAATTTLTGLPAGTYTVTPTDALTGTTVLTAPPQNVTLAGGESRTVTVAYVAAGNFALRLQEVLGTSAGLSGPIDLQAPAGDARIFIAERPGRIRIAQGGTLLATPFLDIASRVTTTGEGGLLSFAFHPQYPAQPFVFVMYVAPPPSGTGPGGDIVIERFQLEAGNANRLQNPGAEVLRIPHREFTNHYGGRVAFGPDGLLYVSVGDGGGGGDPLGNGQNATTLLGKLLRLDVTTLPYTVPATNPAWTGIANARRENWAIGLRNPWRYAFDAPSGVLYVADVGQAEREEINAVPLTSAGLNYGWKVMEGSRCFGAASCNQTGLTLPVLEYDHSQGCSITGGYVYRGNAMPALQGRYFYADFCDGWVRSMRYDGGLAVERVQWLPPGVGLIQSFGVDGAGELYVLTSNGRVLRLERS